MKKENQGITLIALVVTIIVLLILATVSISLVINNGILDKAKSAVDKYSEGEIEEQIKLAYLEWQTAKLTGTTENANDFIKNRLNSSIGNLEDISVDDNALTVTINKDDENKTYYYNLKNGTIKQIEFISKIPEKNYVGYYADIDADGTVDGVIFADLLVGNTKNTSNWGIYEIPTISSDYLKNYYISKKDYEGKFGINDVLSPAGGINDRFYVMELSNFTAESYTKFYWYKNGVSKMVVSDTSENFGKGNENTGKMITKWNAAKTLDGYDAEQDNQDIWKHIQKVYNNGKGWFLPSMKEWAAFANELSITGGTNGNYRVTYGMETHYWSSTILHPWDSIFMGFFDNNLGAIDVNRLATVRLATTF